MGIGEKDLQETVEEENPSIEFGGGLIRTLSDCCNAPVTISPEPELGSLGGGLRYDMCSKCKQPYHPPIYGQ